MTIDTKKPSESPDGPLPAAYCHDCEKWLSPVGSRKAAENAKQAHERNRLTFEGLQHSIIIIEE